MGIEVVHIDVNDQEIDVNNRDKLVKIDKGKVKTDRSEVLKQYNKGTPMFVEFYANWCGHCKTLAPEWKKLTHMIENEYKDKDLAIVSIESDVINKDIDTVLKETGLTVNGFPTIGLIRKNNNKKFLSYDGKRDADSMMKFIKKEAWRIMEGGKRRLTRKRSNNKRKKQTKKRKFINKQKKTHRRKY